MGHPVLGLEVAEPNEDDNFMGGGGALFSLVSFWVLETWHVLLCPPTETSLVNV